MRANSWLSLKVFAVSIVNVVDHLVRIQMGSKIRVARRQGYLAIQILDVGHRRGREDTTAHQRRSVRCTSARRGRLANPHRTGRTCIRRTVRRSGQVAVTEIAIPLRSRRDEGRRSRIANHSPEFPGVKEERLAPAVIEMRNDHRTAKRKAEVVIAKPRNRRHARRQLVEVVIRVKDVVAEKLIQGSVQGVGSALQDGVDHRAAAVAVLRVIRVRLDRHFLNGVGRRDKAHVDALGMPFNMIWY